MTMRQRLHAALFAAVMAALTVGGYVLAAAISQSPVAAATVTHPATTIVHTRVLTKTVRGRVVRLKGGRRVVIVPRVVIHNLRCHPSKENRCVRRIIVPAHRVPLRRSPVVAAVALANPLEPVTVYATVTDPVQTVTLLAQTVTDTRLVTTTDVVTVTVTVPVVPPP